jgi:hypothetical protein
MGVAFFPVLEREVEGLDLSFGGKMLARLGDKQVEKRADLLGFEPLMNFFGFDKDFLFEEFGRETDLDLTEKWFSAEKGLESVKALLEDLTKNPQEYLLTQNEYLGAVDDLKRLWEILEEARRSQVKWYLAIDF